MFLSSVIHITVGNLILTHILAILITYCVCRYIFKINSSAKSLPYTMDTTSFNFSFSDIKSPFVVVFYTPNKQKIIGTSKDSTSYAPILNGKNLYVDNINTAICDIISKNSITTLGLYRGSFYMDNETVNLFLYTSGAVTGGIPFTVYLSSKYDNRVMYFSIIDNLSQYNPLNKTNSHIENKMLTQLQMIYVLTHNEHVGSTKWHDSL